MTIPQVIPFSSIDLGVRGRTTYDGIPQLAESIEHNGLIQPIVLVETNRAGDYSDQYILVAGGRRYRALELLGVTELHHGVTSVPERYGFVLKEEAGTELTNLLTEIAENLDRQNVDWRDETKMLVRAAKLIRQEAHAKGNEIIQRDLGYILGCGFNDIRAAEAIYMDLVAHPEDYKDATSIRGAYQVLLKKNARFLESLLVERTMNRVQSESSQGKEGDATCEESSLEILTSNGEANVQPVVIPLSSRFFNSDGITWMFEHLASIDHVLCDPDFAVSIERLEAGVGGAADGVAQKSIEHSLDELKYFIEGSFRVLKEKGFLVFFCDLDHWEKLQGWATDVGFLVQRWPLIWHKTDARGNASPQCNFTKNVEYAMVCRKPGTFLAISPQSSSIFPCPSGQTTKDFGHPFAKPKALWHWLMQAVAIKGQSMFDPFVGSGSSAVAGIEFGLEVFGCEIQEQHFNGLILNLQKTYRTMLGENVRFE